MATTHYENEISAAVERLFVALWPDAATQAALAEAARQEHDQSRDGRLIPASKLHLTLMFLGDADSVKRACVERALGTVSWQPVTIRFDRLGWFARSRVLWAGSRETPAAMSGLVQHIGQVLTPCGFEPERRPYQAHITLARKVRRPPGTWELAPRDCVFDTLTLVRSVIDSNGSTYEIVGRWPASVPDGTS
jgi:2'-5' RNA ligase